jgi:hypothetical protein
VRPTGYFASDPALLEASDPVRTRHLLSPSSSSTVITITVVIIISS